MCKNKTFQWFEIINQWFYPTGFLLGIAFIGFRLATHGTWIGFDAFYHVRFAQLLDVTERNLRLPWLEFTTCKSSYPDHQWLYHVILKIVAHTGSPVWANILTLMFLGLVFFLFYRLLKATEISHPSFWLVSLLISSVGFLFRLSMVRVQGLTCFLLLLSVYFMIKQHYKALTVVSFFFVWTYTAYIYLPIFAFFFSLASYCNDKTWKWKPFRYTMSGIIPGLIVNPLFPHNLAFTVRSVVERFWITSKIPVGGEWYPLHPIILALDTFPLLVLIFITLRLFFQTQAKMSEPTFFFLFLFTFTTATLAKSCRFIEYAPPFALLFIANLDRDCSEQCSSNRKSISSPLEINQNFCSLIGGIVFLLILFLQLERWNQLINYWSFPFTRFQSVAQWLKDHTEKDEIVYNVAWSDFPQLFYWNPWNRYISGLDPNFIYQYDKTLAEEYYKISQGLVVQPSQIIKKKFMSKYVLVPKTIRSHHNYEQFRKQALDDIGMIKIYEDEYTIVYQIQKK